MKTFFPLLFLFVGACSSSTNKNETETNSTARKKTIDSSDAVRSTVQKSIPEQLATAPETMQATLEYFIKHPFISNHAAIRQSLEDADIAFTDELIGADSVLSFGSSRVAMLVASQEVIDAGLGDLICEADISDEKFVFNSGVAIGMNQTKFLELFGLQPDAPTRDDDGNVYLEREIQFDGGHWKMTVLFTNERVARFAYEITPCAYDLSD